jgi:hypothetical protein
VPFAVSIDATKPYLVVSATGPATLAELSGVVAFVGELVTRQAQRRVLADMGRVEPTLSFTDHLQFGVLASSLLARVGRLAVVVPPDYLDSPAGKAAQRAGLRLRTFLTYEEAAAWVEEQDGAGPPPGRWTIAGGPPANGGPKP